MKLNLTENYQMIELTQNCSTSKWGNHDVPLIRKCLGDNLASFKNILLDHVRYIFQVTHLPTIAFFCLEHAFDKSLDLFVDFHVLAFTYGVKTDNLLKFSFTYTYSSPEYLWYDNISVETLSQKSTLTCSLHSFCK